MCDTYIGFNATGVSAMYDIDFNTCTMNDVIQRSFVCQPSQLRAAMIAAAKVHIEYSNITANASVALIALDMACSLDRMADAIEPGSFDVESLTLSDRVQAFHIAAKLQLVTYHTKREIAERG
jgi:hypothetical protein